jgi:hypothetical protein
MVGRFEVAAPLDGIQPFRVNDPLLNFSVEKLAQQLAGERARALLS